MKYMPNWIMGGIIGVTLPVLFTIIAYCLFMLFEISVLDFPPFLQINEFFWFQCGFLTQCRGQGCLVCILWIPPLVLIEFFFLGALLGWIYSKQKN